MARIVLTTYGSGGDLNPIVALGLGLRARGHDARIAVEGAHRAAVASAGLAVYPLPGDNEATLLPYRRALFGDISPVAFTRILLEHSILPTLDETVGALRAACAGADLLVATMQQAAAGIAAEVAGLSWVSLALSPLAIPSAALAPYPLPAALPHPVRTLVNRAVWAAARHTGRRLSDDALNRVRARHGLRPRRDALLLGNRSPLLAAVAVSPAFVPPPADWPPQARMTGFPFWDAPPTWAEPDDLADFLGTADPRPVVAVSSGSVSPLVGDVFADFYQTSVAAIRRAGARALVIGASPVALPAPLPADALAVPFAPFSAVYPRCAAAIHHGGIGTTAQALRAGIPALVAPWGVDQHFDAAQVARLGAGLGLPRRHYTDARVASMLTALLRQPAYRERAGTIARQIAREDGVAALCVAIEDVLTRPTRAHARA